MKLKGIGSLEQHVEKIVVGVVGVGLLGVVGWQFLSQTTVAVDKGELPLAEAYGPADTAAKTLLRDVENPTPTLPAAQDLSAMNQYAIEASKPVSRDGRLPELGAIVALGPSAGNVGSGESVYAALVGPAPSNVVAAQFRGTVRPSERAAHPEIVPFLPKEQPYDKAAVSVEATLSGKAIRTALETDPDGAGPLAALPADWWMGKTEILGVEVEREEMAADGTWGQAKPLGTLPGRLDFLKTWNTQVKVGGDVGSQLQEASRRSEEILRPKYYDMMFGTWTEPSVLIAQLQSNFDPNLYKSLSDKHTEAKTKLGTAKTQLAAIPPEETGKKPDPTPTPTPPPGGGGGRGPRGTAPAPDGGRPQPEQTKPDETPRAKRTRLTNEVRRIEAEIKQIEKEILAMGGKLPDAAAEVAANPNPADTSTQQALLDREEFKVYSHDITAEPGKTYRYRVRVALNNPIFGKDILLKKGDTTQAELAKSSLAYSAWTEWTPEVAVDRDAYWFITSANNDNLRQNLPTAQASLYQFYYGFYRKVEVSLEPGDPIIGVAKLPPLWLYKETAAQPQPGGEAPAGPVGPRRGGPRGPGAENPGAPQPGAQNGPPEEASGPAKTELLFRETATVVLLDVKTMPGTDNRRVALLRSHDGTVVSRSPDADRQSDVFRRVSASAEAGKAAVEKKAEPKPNNPVTPPPERNPQRAPGGGGGGGGGG